MTPRLRQVIWWFQRRRMEDEMREELRFHLDQEMQERRDAGLPDDEAKWAARRDLGSDALLSEDIRALWRWRPLDELVQDLRFASRTHLKHRAVSLFAILSHRAGHRREHRRLQPDGGGALETDAGPGSAAAAPVHMDYRSAWHPRLHVG